MFYTQEIFIIMCVVSLLFLDERHALVQVRPTYESHGMNTFDINGLWMAS